MIFVEHYEIDLLDNPTSIHKVASLEYHPILLLCIPLFRPLSELSKSSYKMDNFHNEETEIIPLA